MSIYKKLLDIQEKGIALKKDADNPFFKSKYITLDHILDTYNNILTEKGIVCYHYTKDNKLTTVLHDTEDDTTVLSEFNIYNQDPQKQGSEITYGKRYNLGQLLNIQTDADDDGNIASSSGNTKKFYSAPESKPAPGQTSNKYSCSKCGEVNEGVQVKQGQYGPYFKCTGCDKFSDTKNAIHDGKDLSKQDF